VRHHQTLSTDWPTPIGVERTSRWNQFAVPARKASSAITVTCSIQSPLTPAASYTLYFSRRPARPTDWYSDFVLYGHPSGSRKTWTHSHAGKT